MSFWIKTDPEVAKRIVSVVEVKREDAARINVKNVEAVVKIGVVEVVIETVVEVVKDPTEKDRRATHPN